MTREEKCKLAVKQGYTYNPETGDIIGLVGKIITAKKDGYIVITLISNNKRYQLKAHHLCWYITYGKIIDCVDHINNIRNDNRICNLRSVTKQQNQWNKITTKGYYWNKRPKKWRAQIQIDGKVKHLGYYDNEDEAREAYLQAKEKYHII